MCILILESVRETLESLSKPLIAKSTVRLAAGPTGDTDEDILVREGFQPGNNSTL